MCVCVCACMCVRLHPPRTFAGPVSPIGSPHDSLTRDGRFSFPPFDLFSFTVVRSAAHGVPVSAGVEGTPPPWWTRPPGLPTFRTRNSVPPKLDFPSSKPEASPHNPEREAVRTPLGTRGQRGEGTRSTSPAPTRLVGSPEPRGRSHLRLGPGHVPDVLTAQLSGGALGGEGAGETPGTGELHLNHLHVSDTSAVGTTGKYPKYKNLITRTSVLLIL